MRKLLIGLGVLAVIAAGAVGLRAATEDVNLPANYRQTLTQYAVVDRVDNGQVRVLFGTPAAIAAVRANQPMPSGTTLVMEVYAAQRNAANELVRGADGRLVRGNLANIFVMEKRAGWGAQYEKFNRTAQAWSIVAVAATVRSEGGTIAEAKVALTNMGLVPVRAAAVEQALVGQPASAGTVAAAAQHAAEGTSPMADSNADEDYRRHLAKVLTGRAVSAAAGV